MRNVRKQYEKGLKSISTHRDLNYSEMKYIMDSAKAELDKSHNLYECLWKSITLSFYFGYMVGVRTVKSEK